MRFRTYLACVLMLIAACGGEKAAPKQRPLTISAIPDQDPEKLQRLYGSVASYLSQKLGVPVEYKPLTDYKAAVTAFKVGDLDLVWFGGLTGVQARLQVPAAQALLQRDIDERFKSVFVANVASGVKELSQLKGHTFTFGSESSTSGRLMPQKFLEDAGIHLSDFKGSPGFSGSHDKTIALVTAGTFEAGAVNEQVWTKRLAEGAIDTSRIQVVWTTPTYHDYHWLMHPQVEQQWGSEMKGKIMAAFTALSVKDPEQAKILDLFGAERMIPTNNDNYKDIEAVGRAAGLIITEHAQR